MINNGISASNISDLKVLFSVLHFRSSHKSLLSLDALGKLFGHFSTHDKGVWCFSSSNGVIGLWIIKFHAILHSLLRNWCSDIFPQAHGAVLVFPISTRRLIAVAWSLPRVACGLDSSTNLLGFASLVWATTLPQHTDYINLRGVDEPLFLLGKLCLLSCLN